MKCPNHPERDVIDFCHSCGEYLCRECLAEGGDYFYCKKEECQNVIPDIKPIKEHKVINQKNNLLKFAIFLSPLDAHLVKMRLEAGGVRCFIFDENIIQMNWLYSNAVGGVKLYIYVDDLEKAKEIMEVESEDKCPKCDSSEVTYEYYSRLPFFLGWLLFSMPVPLQKKGWKCLKCRHTWKDVDINKDMENK